MTYNQIITELETILGNHKMLKSVIPNEPANWLFWTNQPEFPNASFDVRSGSLNAGRELQYNLSIWFLDKSGVDNEFERDVTSDMLGIANDFVSILRQGFQRYSVDTTIRWDKVEEKFEDYLTGVTLNFNITIASDYGACDVPTL